MSAAEMGSFEGTLIFILSLTDDSIKWIQQTFHHCLKQSVQNISHQLNLAKYMKILNLLTCFVYNLQKLLLQWQWIWLLLVLTKWNSIFGVYMLVNGVFIFELHWLCIKLEACRYVHFFFLIEVYALKYIENIYI